MCLESKIIIYIISSDYQFSRNLQLLKMFQFEKVDCVHPKTVVSYHNLKSNWLTWFAIAHVPLRIVRQWSLENFPILTLKPQSVMMLLRIYRTWAILTERRSVTSHYYGSKMSWSQQQLNNIRRRPQRERQKSSIFIYVSILTKQQLYTCITLFSDFFPINITRVLDAFANVIHSPHMNDKLTALFYSIMAYIL